MDEKKLHTWEFQPKDICRNMRCKLHQKRYSGKTTECSSICKILPLNFFFLQNLADAVFQTSLYIKLVIPKILFIYTGIV